MLREDPEDAKRSCGEPSAVEHPYRSAAMTTTHPHPISAPESREDIVVGAAIAFVGALGVAIGLVAPERTVEPSLGLLMLIFVASTFVSERRRRRGIRTHNLR